MTGKVTYFNRKRGYGYIAGDDGRNYPVRACNIRMPCGNLPKDFVVEFTPCINNRGFEAEDVVFYQAGGYRGENTEKIPATTTNQNRD